MARRIRQRWHAPGGYRELIAVAAPLTLSAGAIAAQLFVDRVFLTWHSPAAIAAVMPAGTVAIMTMSLFIGTAEYTRTFVAQYCGNRRFRRVGPSVWQGVWIAAVGGVVHLAMIPLAGPFFRWVGHDPAVVENEIAYFQIFCLGAGPTIAAAALAGFFSGRGRTWPLLWVNVGSITLNIVLTYVLVFDELPWLGGGVSGAGLGIKGAAIATVTATVFSCVAYLLWMGRRTYRKGFRSLRGWRLRPALFGRLIRFGLPNGVQLALDLVAFTGLLLLLGRQGAAVQTATSIAFSINMLAFMPMVGIGIAVSVLVGQHIGRGDPDSAERSAYSGIQLALPLIGIIALAYVIVPDVFIAPFAAGMDADVLERSFPVVRVMTIWMLRFVALYCALDACCVIFGGALKGAGDTLYVMIALGASALAVLIVPTFIGMELLGQDAWFGWLMLSLYILALATAFLLRFRAGQWKSMSVIGRRPPLDIPPPPEALPHDRP